MFVMKHPMSSGLTHCGHLTDFMATRYPALGFGGFFITAASKDFPLAVLAVGKWSKSIFATVAAVSNKVRFNASADPHLLKIICL